MSASRAARGKERPRTSAEQLREQAEAVVAGTADSVVPDDTVATLHELRVHQIELEMQNDQLRSAQLELDEQREKYFELFDMAPVGYITMNDKGLVSDANLTAVHILAVERQLLVGQPFSAFVLARDRDVYYLQQRRLRETGETQTCELRLRRFGGDASAGDAQGHFWAQLVWRLQHPGVDGTPASWVTFTDVNSRKGAEDSLVEANAVLLRTSRQREHLNGVLNEINSRLTASFEVDAVLDGVLELACEALECDVALIGRAAIDDPRVEHAFGLESADGALAFDQSLLDGMSSDTALAIVCEGSPYEAGLCARLGLTEAIVTRVRAARGAGKALVFGRTTGARRFDDQSVDFVRRLALSLALALTNAAQFETERHIAETLQHALLLMPPSIQGLEFSELYRSATLATLVGGDFFDVFRVAGGLVGVLVGDVSGKGLEAAVHTSVIKDTIRAYAYETASPAAAMARANVALYEAVKIPEFATVFYAVVDGPRNTITYCGAGHPPAIVLASDGTVRLLEGGSPIIGAFPNAVFTDRTVSLASDEMVLLYTDGVTEARSAEGVFFGEEGLPPVLRSAGTDAPSVTAAVLDAVMTFCGGRLQDDIALLAFHHTGSPAVL